MKRKLTWVLKVVAAVTATVVLTGVGLELYGRVEFARMYAKRGYTPVPSAYPGLQYQLKPDADHDINRRGLRGPNFPLRKPDGQYRILALGDSLTYGVHLPAAQVYPALLQQTLEEEPGVPGEPMVINAGVPGYNLSEIVAAAHYWLETLGPRGQPDLLVYGFFPNDFDRTYVIQEANGIVYTILPDEPSRVLLGQSHPALHRWLLVHSRYYGFWATARGGALARNRQFDKPYEDRRRWGQGKVEELQEVARAAGIPLISVAIAPHVLAFNDGRDEGFDQALCDHFEAVHDDYLEIARQAGLPTVDSLAAMREQAQDGYFIEDIDDPTHPDPRGYQVIADTVADLIRGQPH